MNSVIIPHLPPAGPAPVAYHHKAAAGYGYGIPAQGYLSYTPQQQKYGFHHHQLQPQQPTTPTDVFSVAAAAMMQPRGPQYFQQKRQFEFPGTSSSRESLFPGKSQQYQPRYQPQPQPYPTAAPAPAVAVAANRAPEVRTTSSTRPNRTKSEVCKPLFVDCSIEYDLPNVPKISAGKDGKAEPILMIHPAYLKRNQQSKRQQSYPQPVACNVRDCQCQMAMARQRQMLQQQQQQQQQQFIRQQQQQQQQQVEATRKAVKRSYEANFQHQQTTMNAGKAKWDQCCEPRRISKKLGMSPRE